MHLRRSLLCFLVGGALFLSLTLLLWSYSLPWSRSGRTTEEHDFGTIIDEPLHLGNTWLDPKPGDDTLRKNPMKGADSKTNYIGVSSSVLRDRLQALLDAPVLSHSAAAPQNEKACPRLVADKQVNPDQLKGNRERWIAVSEKDIQIRRRAIVQHLEQLEKDRIVIMGVGSEGVGSGRGVVMTAGNKDTAQTALVALRLLRLEYKSTLPVQVFSFAGELIDQRTIDEMRELGATHHELPGLQKVDGAWKNFQLKAASILSSTFEEVLYLDSDNVPLRDPVHLFDEETYKSGGGAVFWPDYNKDHPDNAIWRMFGKTCDYTEWEVESGQVLINKRGNHGLNLAALHIAAHMQAEHDFWFSLSGGDKDTFRYAFWALNAQYLAAPRWLSALGSSHGRDAAWQQGMFCGYVMLQYDIAKNEEGQHLPLFVHANLLKHRASSDPGRTRRLFQTIKRASQDDANEPSLDRVKMWVYQDGGMCVDLNVDAASDHAVDAASDNVVAAGKSQSVVKEQFAEVYGGKFKDFEEQFFRHKGKVGGW